MLNLIIDRETVISNYMAQIITPSGAPPLYMTQSVRSATMHAILVRCGLSSILYVCAQIQVGQPEVF